MKQYLALLKNYVTNLEYYVEFLADDSEDAHKFCIKLAIDNNLTLIDGPIEI